MERIKQAMERARQERESGTTSTADTGSTIDPARLPLEAGNGGAGAPPHISYTQTRIVRVDPQVLRRNRVISGTSDPAVVDAYRMLRTRVLQRMHEKGWRSLAITSAGPNEGKTLTAVNLALSLAMDVNHTVMLVDLDLRRPSVHRLFGYEPKVGVADYLFSDIPLSSVLFTPSVERLVVLPGGTKLDNSSEMLSMPRTREMVEDITKYYPERIVLFDLPPILMVDDALAFAPFVDAFMLVVEEGETAKPALKQATELLKNTNLLGTVLNKGDHRGKYYDY
jgi:capsular exopolysaccharide synthesis family protein